MGFLAVLLYASPVIIVKTHHRSSSSTIKSVMNQVEIATLMNLVGCDLRYITTHDWLLNAALDHRHFHSE